MVSALIVPSGPAQAKTGITVELESLASVMLRKPLKSTWRAYASSPDNPDVLPATPDGPWTCTDRSSR
ncbi:hypothetical protein [Nonomuraea typhae]|uniref:Uncharacterized protein n=1 Tax=Nonomuraea typhae TaxID=2603600 RepID=A0ABW7ZD19_9ACTN